MNDEYSYSLCVDCHDVFRLEGENLDGAMTTETAATCTDLMARLTADGSTLINMDYMLDEFATSPCECCGDRHAGMRFWYRREMITEIA